MDAATLTSQPTSRCNRLATALSLGATLAGISMLTGCAGQARTRVEGPATVATHETTAQTPGIIERWIVEIGETGVADGGATKPNPLGDQPGSRGGAKKTTPPDGEADTLRAAIEAAARLGAESGQAVRIEYSREIPLTTDTAASTLDDRGASLDHRGAEGAATLDQAPRRLSMPWATGGRAEASGGGYGLTSEIYAGSGINVLHVFAGLIGLCALIPILVPPRRIVEASLILGVALVMAAAGTVGETYPWLMAVALIGVVGLIGWGAYSLWRSARKSEALKAIVPAVHENNVGKVVTSKVRANAVKNRTAKAVRAEVTAIKNKLGMDTETDVE